MCLAQGPQRSDASEALWSRVKHSTTEPPIKKLKNNLDPGQATMVVFPGGGGGGGGGQN